MRSCSDSSVSQKASIDRQLGLLRYEPSLRVAAQFWWQRILDDNNRSEMGLWIAGFAKLARLEVHFDIGPEVPVEHSADAFLGIL